MTKDEVSLLLYLETCAVDYGGLVDQRRMNGEDLDLARRWNDEGFLLFKRLKVAYIRGHNSYYVELNDKSWEEAHKQRKLRAIRNYHFSSAFGFFCGE